MARYYLVDSGRNLPASTEITGYAASTFVYLHSVTRDHRYLDRAVAAARFLVCAWDSPSSTMPFEIDPAAFTYFFDCGIVVRGLLVRLARHRRAAIPRRRRGYGRLDDARFRRPSRRFPPDPRPSPPAHPWRATHCAGRAPPPAIN